MTDHKPRLSKADLRLFTGTERWYRHPLVRSILYTDGAQYVAENGDAYWLLDEIAFAQIGNDAVKALDFQVWTLKVATDRTAVLTCEDGNVREAYSKSLIFTDFPLDEIRFYFTNNVVYLPSEH